MTPAGTPQLYSWSHRRYVAAIMIGIVSIIAGPPHRADAQDTATIEQAIIDTKSPDAKSRIDSGAYLIDNWKQSLPFIIADISSYSKAETGRPFVDDDIPGLVNITDVLRAIVVNKDGGIEAFRVADNNQTTRLLTWASRDDNRSIRLNATYLLANVVDNTNFCIILHHLRDPQISADGLVNLIQVATSAASYAYSENVTATKETIRLIRDRIPGSEFPKTMALLDALERRIGESSNINKPLPPSLPYCRDYDFSAPL